MYGAGVCTAKDKMLPPCQSHAHAGQSVCILTKTGTDCLSANEGVVHMKMAEQTMQVCQLDVETISADESCT